jgi:hypothetical protein
VIGNQEYASACWGNENAKRTLFTFTSPRRTAPKAGANAIKNIVRGSIFFIAHVPWHNFLSTKSTPFLICYFIK